MLIFKKISLLAHLLLVQVHFSPFAQADVGSFFDGTQQSAGPSRPGYTL